MKMKKLIRKNVFETNSSSNHSISMASDDKQFVLDTIYPDQFGKIYVNGGEFGWDWAKYNDAETKLNYAFQDGVSEKLLEKVVKEQTGATEVVFKQPIPDKPFYEDGHIDHASIGTANMVCVDEESTRNFIFNKNSWLFTGNDNGTPEPTFYHVPIYQDGKIIRPIYKYELTIDGLDERTYFIDKPTDEELEDGINSIMSGALMTEDGYVFKNNDIGFQITRFRDMYEKSWGVLQDYSKEYIIMVKEGSYLYNTEEKLKKEGKFDGLDYYEKQKLVTEELLKDETICKKLPFTLKEI